MKEWLHLASSAYPRSKLNQHLEADPSGASERGWLQTPTSQYRRLSGTDTILPWDFSTRTFQTLPLKLLSSEVYGSRDAISIASAPCYHQCCNSPLPKSPGRPASGPLLHSPLPPFVWLWGKNACYEHHEVNVILLVLWSTTCPYSVRSLQTGGCHHLLGWLRTWGAGNGR